VKRISLAILTLVLCWFCGQAIAGGGLDGFLVFQIGQMAHRPPETVVQTYQAYRGKRGGVIAK